MHAYPIYTTRSLLYASPKRQLTSHEYVQHPFGGTYESILHESAPTSPARTSSVAMCEEGPRAPPPTPCQQATCPVLTPLLQKIIAKQLLAIRCAEKKVDSDDAATLAVALPPQPASANEWWVRRYLTSMNVQE